MEVKGYGKVGTGRAYGTFTDDVSTCERRGTASAVPAAKHRLRPSLPLSQEEACPFPGVVSPASRALSAIPLDIKVLGVDRKQTTRARRPAASPKLKIKQSTKTPGPRPIRLRHGGEAGATPGAAGNAPDHPLEHRHEGLPHDPDGAVVVKRRPEEVRQEVPAGRSQPVSLGVAVYQRVSEPVLAHTTSIRDKPWLGFKCRVMPSRRRKIHRGQCREMLEAAKEKRPDRRPTRATRTIGVG